MKRRRRGRVLLKDKPAGIVEETKLSVTRRVKQLMAVESDGRYILKPQTQSFRHLPENENHCMNMAAQLGIEVPPHGLFRLRADAPNH